METLIIITLSLAVILGIYTILSDNDKLCEISGVCAIALFIFAVMFLPILSMRNEDNKTSRIENALNSGYTLYVNGIEVDKNHVTIEDYDLSTITVHDDTKEIHIAANR